MNTIDKNELENNGQIIIKSVNFWLFIIFAWTTTLGLGWFWIDKKMLDTEIQQTSQKAIIILPEEIDLGFETASGPADHKK